MRRFWCAALLAALLFSASFSSDTLQKFGRYLSSFPVFREFFRLSEEEAREVFAPEEEKFFL